MEKKKVLIDKEIWLQNAAESLLKGGTYQLKLKHNIGDTTKSHLTLEGKQLIYVNGCDNVNLAKRTMTSLKLLIV